MSRGLRVVVALLLPLLALPSPGAQASDAPNLALRKLTTGTTGVQAFDDLTVKSTVVRSGRVPGGLHVEYVLSKDQAKSAEDVPLIGVRTIPRGAGRNTVSTRLTTYGVTPPGRYFVVGCADPGRDLRESSERDNCRATGTRVKVVAAPTGRTQDVATTLAGGRRKHLELFLRGLDRFGTEAGQVTATGTDGTRYTLSVPQDAGLMALPITMTPIASVSGLPGSPRAMGVKITPEYDLTRAATLTVVPGQQVREDRALPATYDGDGTDVRLTPMTSKPGAFTFQVTHLGGFLLIEGAGPTARPVARASGGTTLKDLYSWTPATRKAVNDADVQALLAAERQRQLIGSDDDGETQSAVVEAALAQILGDVKAEIAAADAHPTIGQWHGLIRFILASRRQFQLIDADERPLEALYPLLRPVLAKVVAGVHACDDGMGDVLATLELRANNDVNGALFDLPPDTDTSCTHYRAHVSYAESQTAGSVDDDPFQTAYSFSAGATWSPQDLLDHGGQDVMPAYEGSYHDVCEHGEGPITPQPWTLGGLNIYVDELFQHPVDPQAAAGRSPVQLLVGLLGATQEGVLDDPGCDEATGFDYGPYWDPTWDLDYVDGVLSGEGVEDQTFDDGSRGHTDYSYDVTAVK